MRTAPVLSIAEAADFLRVGRTTLWRLAREGCIHPVRIRRRVVFLVSDLERFLQEQVASKSNGE